MRKNRNLFILLWCALSCVLTSKAQTTVTDADFDEYGLFMYEGLPYHLLDDGSVELCNVEAVKSAYISGNGITIENVVIPAVVSHSGKEYNVTKIGDNAFQGCASVKTVVIPEGVTEIGYQAFYNANNVQWPEMPSTLRTICGNCFYMCRNLGKIVLPEGLTTLHDGCFSRTFDMGGYISELVFPGSLTTIIDDFNDFGNLCSDRRAGTVGKIVFNANSDWEDLKFSFNTFSRGLTCKEIVINRDLIDADAKWSPVNIAKVTGLETIRYGEQVTKLPDMSGCASLATVYCDAPTPPANLNLPSGREIEVIVPEQYADAYRSNPLWAEYMPKVVEPSPVNAYVDFSKLGYTVGDGEKLGAVMISWNDGPRKGVDHLIYGVRFNESSTAENLISTVVGADSRLVSLDGAGYAYDNLDKGSIVEKYDHYAANNSEYRWNIYSDEKPGDGSVVYLCYEPVSRDGLTVPDKPSYQFYIPEESVIGGRIPENYEMPIADEMIIPVWARTGGISGVYAYFAWNASHFKVNTQGANQAAMAEGRPYVTVDFTYVEFINGEPRRYVPQTQDDVSASVNLSSSSFGNTSGTKIECDWSPKIPMKVVGPEIPVTKINNKNISVAGTMSSTALKDLVDYEPADATYTRFFVEILDADNQPRPLYRQDVMPAPWTDEDELYPGHEYWLGEWSVSSGAKDLVLNLKYFYGLNEIGENSYTQPDGVEGKLSFTVSGPAVKAVALDGDYGTNITVTSHDIFALRTKAMPPAANQAVSISIENPTVENMANCYGVRGYMPDGKTNGQFTELVTYKAGEFDLVLTSMDNKSITRTYHVTVTDPDGVDGAQDFTTGTFWLNEEWFTHKNGSLNYLTSPVVDSDEEIIYRPYTRINGNAGFGATSQYATIFHDKLFVMSKQEHDKGDIRGQVGGRLVVADATTLKTLASFSEIGGDGRACVGVRPGKAYIGHNNGIRVLTWDDSNNMTLADTDIEGITGGGTDLYNSQVGDMVASARYVFAIQQFTGLHIIDSETDKLVRTIDDGKIGAVAQTADGTVWYATATGASSGHSMLHRINPVTLEEIGEPVEVPGKISTGWGAWRSCNFFGSTMTNKLFWNGAASSIEASGDTFYAWDTETPAENIEPLYTFPQTSGVSEDVKQTVYASMRYDDRTNCLLFATTTAPSGNYRYNWLNFLNVDDCSLKSVRLKDYYWFPSMPVFPDCYEPEMEDVDGVELIADGDPVTIELNATDRDNIDANIRYSIVDGSALRSGSISGPVVEASIDGNKLTLTPKSKGKHTIGVAVESNGKTIYRGIDVNVTDIPAGIDGITAGQSGIMTRGDKIVVVGYAGTAFRVVNMAGAEVDAFTAPSDSYTRPTSLQQGVYVIMGDNGVSKKIIIK